MKTDFIQANEVKLQYFEHGEGPEVLVLVHGYQSSGRIWQLMQEALDPARFRTIAIIIPDTKEHNHKWESSAYICIIRIDSHKDNPIKLSILNAVFSR